MSAAPIENGPRFDLGRVVATPALLAVAEAEGIDLRALLARHHAGDWGEVDKPDARANELALKHGERLLSAYQVGGTRIWIITEADRSSTCLLRPADYLSRKDIRMSAFPPLQPGDQPWRFSGKKMRERRRELHYSRSRLAGLAELDRAAVKGMEQDRICPTDPAFKRLSSALGLTAERAEADLLVHGPSDHRPTERDVKPPRVRAPRRMMLRVPWLRKETPR